MSKSYKDKLKDLRDYAAQGARPGYGYKEELKRTAEASISYTRQDVRQVSEDEPAPAPETQPVKRSKADSLNEVVDRSPEAYRAFNCVVMLASLLRNSYKPHEAAVSDMGFDEDNLDELMQVVFKLAHGKKLPEATVIGYLERPDRRAVELLYFDVLGLKESSSPKEIEDKARAFAKKMQNSLPELIRFKRTGFVNEALRRMKSGVRKINAKADLTEDEKIDQINQRKMEIIKKCGFDGSPIVFDQDKVVEILASSIDFESLLAEKELKTSMYTLRGIRDAVQSGDDYDEEYADRFNGDELATVIQNLDELFERDGVDLGLAITSSSMKDLTLRDLTKIIANEYGIDDSDELKAKLAEVERAIGSKYYHLLHKKSPVRAEMPDFATFKWNKAYYPFYHLYYALGRQDSKYRAPFGSISQEELMTAVDEVLGDGMARHLQAAAHLNKDEAAHYSPLAEAIAYKEGIKDATQLKTRMIELSQLLVAKFGDSIKTA